MHKAEAEETHDGRQLRGYLERGDQAAFARLVGRYLGLVYSACLRETGSPPQAEDAAQAVFLLLARKAPSLTARTSLAGWLFAAARLVSRNARRQEKRRQRQEQQAMEETTRSERDAQADAAAWAEIAPALNDALAALSGREREAVLLRFFQGLSLAETGGTLGVSADAAQMRVARALEKLRRHLAKAGVGVPGAALAVLLPAHAAHGLPTGGAALSFFTPGALGAAGASAYRLYQGVVKAMWMTKVKTVAGIAAASLAAAGAVPLMAHARHHPVQQRKATAAAPPGKGPAVTTAAPGPHVYVYGAVARPGRYDLRPGDRTMDAVADAGGFLPGADTRQVGVIHPGADKTTTLRRINVGRFLQRGDMAGNLLVAPGDTVYVSKKHA